MKSRALFGTTFAKGFGRAWLVGGFLFLYLPMVTLMIFSFNHSRLASHWGGFSLEWYRKLADDTEIINGLWLSLKIAFTSATGSVILGTMAAFTLVKYRRFTGRTFFSGMVNAPLVMPEVIQGLSLLLMLVAIQRVIGFPERGMFTIWLGHLMIGRVIWDENFSNNDPPMASTVAVVLVLLIVVPLAIFNKYQAEAQEKRK